MSYQYKNGNHAQAASEVQPRLRTRIGTAIVAGCLALSVCPTVALAVQPGQGGPGQGGPGQGGNPPAMQQFNGGSAPSQNNGGSFEAPQGNPPSDQGQMNSAPEPPTQDENAPDMQQPPAGVQPGNDATGDQVRQILSDEYSVDTTRPENAGQPSTQPPSTDAPAATDASSMPSAPGAIGAPGEAPELPEGAVNVQQVIDATRDVLLKFSGVDFETKLADNEFATALQNFAKAATEQRLAQFASGERPSMENPGDASSADSATLPASAPSEIQEVSASVMSQIVALIMDVFGYVTA